MFFKKLTDFFKRKKRHEKEKDTVVKNIYIKNHQEKLHKNEYDKTKIIPFLYK